MVLLHSVFFCFRCGHHPKLRRVDRRQGKKGKKESVTTSPDTLSEYAFEAVFYTISRPSETVLGLECGLLIEKKNQRDIR